MLTAVVTLVAILAAAAAATAWRRRRSRAPHVRDSLTDAPSDTAEQLAPLTQLGALGRRSGRARRASGNQVAISELRGAAQMSWLVRERVRAADMLRLDLADVRDDCGGDEAVLWRWVEERGVLAPVGWSTEDVERPAAFSVTSWGAHVQWAAEERKIHFAGDGPVPELAAAPVFEGEELYGVLTVTAKAGIARAREDLRDRLPRHAARVHRLVATAEAGMEAGRVARQSRALLEAIRRIQSQPTADALGRAICETAIAASSALAAALVRWDDGAATGRVQFATGFRHRPEEIAPDSLVAHACRERTVVSPEAVLRARGTTPLFTVQRPEGARGDAAVIPVVREHRALGAIVVWAPDEGVLSDDEIANLRTLSAAATTSLEGVWHIEEAERRARTDPLTGLGNRRFLEDRLEVALAETDRFATPTSLLLVDIDHFKQVNDSWGHDAGDHVLRRVAAILREGVRNVDTCVRYGGEEFAILLPQTSQAGAVELADRLRRAVAAQPVFWQATAIPVTASFGVSCYPESVPSRDVIVANADAALYEAKRAGRNCVRHAALRAAKPAPPARRGPAPRSSDA